MSSYWSESKLSEKESGVADATLVMSHNKSVILNIHNQAWCCRTVGGDNNQVNNSEFVYSHQALSKQSAKDDRHAWSHCIWSSHFPAFSCYVLLFFFFFFARGPII